MIYTIKNGKLVKSVAKNGKKFKTQSKRSKKLNTFKSKKYHRFWNFYQSTQWKNLSRNYRKQHPICERCLRLYYAGKIPLTSVRIAQSVDHVRALKTKDGYRHRLDPNNLQSLCHQCHVLKNKHDAKL